MSLLARLAPHLGGYKETIGTEALGVLLADDAASRAITAALRVGLPELPDPLRFVTQAGSGETRPDVVGLHGDREVLHIEGKFWAGLTDAQAENKYFHRLAHEHSSRDPAHPCSGIVLWVCPPRRASDLWTTTVRLSGGTQLTADATSGWRYARTVDGQGLALVSWQHLCDLLEHAGTPALAEDVRQLRGFTDEVDRNAFMPWTVEQMTDQAASRRHIELVQLTKDIRARGQRQGILTKKGRNATATTEGATGVVIYLGDVWTAFMVSPELHSAHGLSPWWLQWYQGGGIAREALRDHGLVETSSGCAVPVPLRPGGLRDEVSNETLHWLATLVPLLGAARKQRATRSVGDTNVDEPPDGVLEDSKPLV